MKRLTFVLAGLLALTYLSACADNNTSPPVQADGTRDTSAQHAQNDKDLQNLQNDPHNFSALPTTQPLSDSKMPQNND